MNIRKIDNPEQVYTYISLTVIADGHVVPNRTFGQPDEDSIDYPFITPSLAEIQRAVNSRSILVISEIGVRGEIYRYGNHGDYWELVGETCGYA